MDNEKPKMIHLIHKFLHTKTGGLVIKPRILIADDIESNRILLCAMLSKMGNEVIHAANGKEALEKVKTSSPDLILLDIMMPEMDGFEVLKYLKEDKEFQIIPVVVVTSLEDLESRVKALECGADDFLIKPIEKSELSARVRSLLKVKAFNDHLREYQKVLEKEVEEKTKELRKALEMIKEASLDTIFLLSKAAEYRDKETGNHILRVSNASAAIARKMGLDPHTVETIMYASPMHDVGKIGIPDNILLKPGRLDELEIKIMHEHSEIGAKILAGSHFEFIKVAKKIAMSHHEKWDGTGYPLGLIGEEIPIEARITAIADVFDALMSKRPYKEPFSLEQSIEIIKKSSGTHFDPAIVQVFLEINDEILKIRERFRD